jgi:hypothetical protein
MSHRPKADIRTRDKSPGFAPGLKLGPRYNGRGPSELTWLRNGQTLENTHEIDLDELHAESRIDIDRYCLC